VDSYSEVSLSGTGIHIIARGSVPAGRKVDGVEIYSSRRCFVMTGQHLDGTPLTIEDRDEIVNELWSELTAQQGWSGIKTAMIDPGVIDWDADPESIKDWLDEKIAFGPQFRRTWEHNRPDLADQSMSAYDLSLVSQAVLVHEVLDPTLLYLLIRQHRGHWGKAAGKKNATRRDYVRRTIGVVLASLEEDEGDDVDFWPAPLGLAAFHGLAGEVVDTIFPHSEADRGALLVQFLAAFGNASDRNPHAKVEADRHGANLFVAIVVATGTSRKGTSWGHIKDLFKRADPEWAKERILSGLATGEDLINQVRDRVESVSL
jgi:hypothetical protein